MDDLPKENQAGEVFSGQSSSDYGAAAAPPEIQPSQPPEAVQDEQSVADNSAPSQQTYGNADIGGPAVPAEGGSPPPPPFVESSGRKYIVLAVGFLVILLGVFLLMKLFSSRKTASTPQNVTLTYWGLWEDKDVMQPILDDYHRLNPTVTVQYVKQDPKLYRERVQSAIERGKGPDIFRFHNTWMPMLLADLSPLPKSVYSDDEYSKTFFPVVSSDLKAGGNFYGVPLEIDGLVLFYNDDILKSANVSPPVTWDDMQKSTSKLTVKQQGKIVTAGVALGTADNVEHFSDILGLMMYQNGVQLTKSLTTCADPSSTTCGIEALSFYHKFSEQPNNSWDNTLDNSIIAFSGGKVAMIIAPSWEALTIAAANPNLKFKTSRVPQLPCDKPPCPAVDWATYWVEGVSAKSLHGKEAWDFLKYLSSDTVMRKLYQLEVTSRKLFGEPYSRVDLAKTLADNPYLGPLVAEGPTMKSFYLASRTEDGDTGIDTSLIKYLTDAVNSLNQGVSPDTAIQTADKGFREVVSRFSSAPAQ